MADGSKLRWKIAATIGVILFGISGGVAYSAQASTAHVPTPAASPTAEEPPRPSFQVFTVGADIAPGLYVSQAVDGQRCVIERHKRGKVGKSSLIERVASDGIAYWQVFVTDGSVRTKGCLELSLDERAQRAADDKFLTSMFRVGTDVMAGEHVAREASPACVWSVQLYSTAQGAGAVVASGEGSPMQVPAGAGFVWSQGCGRWSPAY